MAYEFVLLNIYTSALYIVQQYVLDALRKLRHIAYAAWFVSFLKIAARKVYASAVLHQSTRAVACPFAFA